VVFDLLLVAGVDDGGGAQELCPAGAARVARESTKRARGEEL
jgi:hypothetical protein